MRKFITIIFSVLIVALSLCGCATNEEKAKNVTKDFITALENNNFDELKKCYSPKLKENTKILDELKKNGKTSLTKHTETEIELKNIKKCSINDKTGKIAGNYTINIGDTVKLDCTVNFDLVKIGSKWYLESDPKINSSAGNKKSALSNAKTIELAIKYCQSNITHRNNEVYNNNNTYVDLDGVTQTVPDAVEERAKITTYDVFGVNKIFDAVKPVIYDGEMFEPYWDTHKDKCIFMTSDYVVMSTDENYIYHTISDTITPLTENGQPGKQVIVYGL